MSSIEIRRLGLIPFQAAWEIQRETLEARAENRTGDTLLVVEHPLVFTLGRKSPGVREDPESLPKELGGIPVHIIERGGEATFHGPGQVVLYPIFKLDLLRTGPRNFLRLMEEAIVSVLAREGIEAYYVEGKTGVWLKDRETGRERKIASLGIAVRKSVSYHGLALNVNNDLSCTKLISPCGFSSDTMTSVAEQLGHEVGAGLISERLAREVIERFERAMSREKSA